MCNDVRLNGPAALKLQIWTKMQGFTAIELEQLEFPQIPTHPPPLCTSRWHGWLVVRVLDGIEGWLVVWQLPRLQPKWMVLGRIYSKLCRRDLLVHLVMTK